MIPLKLELLFLAELIKFLHKYLMKVLKKYWITFPPLDSFLLKELVYWLQKLLYYEAPEWVFVTAYSAFGLVVLLTLLLVPPRLRASE